MQLSLEVLGVNHVPRMDSNFTEISIAVGESQTVGFPKPYD